jgi:hypothetical protein
LFFLIQYFRLFIHSKFVGNTKSFLLKHETRFEILLYFIYLATLAFAFDNYSDIDGFNFIMLMVWLPFYYVFKETRYYDIFSKSLTSYYDNVFSYHTRKTIVATFALPVIGPLIAMWWIEYLKDKTEEKEVK